MNRVSTDACSLRDLFHVPTLDFFFKDVLKYQICQKRSHFLLRLRRICDLYFLFLLVDHSVQVLIYAYIYICVCVCVCDSDDCNYLIYPCVPSDKIPKEDPK
jgi:hypothetical protein